MKPIPPDERLPAMRKASSLERIEEHHEDTIREKRTLVVHHHKFNWAAIIIALAILIRALVAAAQSM